jgi:hypothetical protein
VGVFAEWENAAEGGLLLSESVVELGRGWESISTQ